MRLGGRQHARERFERTLHLLHRLVALGRVLREQLVDHHLDEAGRRVGAREARRAFAEDAAEQRVRGVDVERERGARRRRERHVAGQHLVEHDAERVDVAAAIDRTGVRICSGAMYSGVPISVLPTGVRRSAVRMREMPKSMTFT